MSTKTVKNWLSKVAKLLFRRSLSVLWLALLAGCIFLLSELTIDHRLRAKNADLMRELARVESTVIALKEKVFQLRSGIDRLKNDPQETAYHARSDLGMVRGGEVIYQFTEESGRPVRTGRESQ